MNSCALVGKMEHHDEDSSCYGNSEVVKCYTIERFLKIEYVLKGCARYPKEPDYGAYAKNIGMLSGSPVIFFGLRA